MAEIPNLKQITGGAVIPPEIERKIEALIFTHRRYHEAVEAIGAGLHGQGCEAPVGEYLFCKCYQEIAAAATFGDDIDTEEPHTRPDVPGGGRIVQRLGDMAALRCLQCRTPFSFEDWGRPVECRCWTRPRPLGGIPESDPWPPPAGLEYSVEEAVVVLVWKRLDKPQD